MARGTGIIVCSISQSQTSNDVVEIIQQLCPGEKVIFQLAQRKTRFDCRKVVFCHSSLEGRLALTDVNDSIYDDAITQANKIVGQKNVTFIVTKVPAADANLRRRMITHAQPTLISNVGMLLLVDRTDDISHLDQDNVNKLNKFLNKTADPTDCIRNEYLDNINQEELRPIDGIRHRGDTSSNSMFVLNFLLLTILLMMILCLAFFYKQGKEEELRAKDFRDHLSGVINAFNHSLIQLQENVKILQKTIENEKSSIETILTGYIEHTENTTRVMNFAIANITKQILAIDTKLQNIERQQEMQKKYNAQQFNKLLREQENIKNMQNSTDQQIFDKIDKVNSTVVAISADVKQLLQAKSQQSYNGTWSTQRNNSFIYPKDYDITWLPWCMQSCIASLL